MRKLYLFLLSVIVAGTLFQSNAAVTDLYIRGAQFGWEAKDCTDANKFTTTDGNVYKITLATLKSGFKIATLTSSGGWNDSYNFGSASNIEPGKEYTLTTSGNSGNITTKGGANLTDVTLTFTLSTKKLKVEGKAQEAKYPEALFLVGDFNGWNTSDANYKMTREGETGKYVIENVNIPAGKKIKFCDGSWDKNWGAANDGDPLPVGTEFAPKYNANNYKLSKALTNATVEFYYNIEDIESAKAKVTNGGDTPTPEKYTVKFDNSLTKWESVSAYFFGGEYEGAEWPGVTMTKGSGDIWTVSIDKGTVAPTSVIFNDGKVEGAKQTSEFAFENGKTYKAELKTINVKYNNGKTKWSKVYAYFWKEGAGDVGPAWHGTEMTLESGTIYTVSLQVLDLPTNVKFNDGADGEGEAEIFENGKTYGEGDTPQPENYTVYYDNSVTNWPSVKACFKGEGYTGENWPGLEMTKVEGSIWSVTIDKGTAAPSTVTFSCKDAVGSKQTDAFAFEDGKTYKAVAKTLTIRYNNAKTKWTSVKAYMYVDGGYSVGKTYPGNEMTWESGTIYKFTMETYCFPTKVQFIGGTGLQSDYLVFENDKTYGEGYGPQPEKYTVKFDNSLTKWESVSAYFFGGEYEGTEWPGVTMTKESGDIWTVSIDKGTVAPTSVIFNDGKAEGAKQTSEFAFENGKTYKAELKTINVKYNNSKTAWSEVYAYFWKEGQGTIGEEWPGTKMTLENGTIYTVSFQALDLPTNVKFNDGADGEGEAEIFENGKTYGDGSTPVVTYPENLYVIGQVDGATGDWTANHGVALTKSGATYTTESVVIEDAGEGYGYIGLATQLGTTATDWDAPTGLNGGDRYGSDAKDAPLTPGTPAAIVKYPSDVNASAATSWKVAAGTYSLTADLENMSISIVKKDEPTPEYPELYVRGTMTDYNVKPEYKMTREGKVYTLSGIEIPAGAKFKISDDTDNWAINFGGTGVEGVEGEQTDELANGTEKNAWFNSSVNFTVAKKLTNATVTFTFEGAKTGVANKIKVEGTEVDDPQPENPDLYIIGLNGDWNNFPDSNKFAHAEGTTTYTLELASMPAESNFKFCPLYWGGEGEHTHVFGAETAEGGKIADDKLGTVFNMKRSDQGSFNFVTTSKLKEVKITLDIDYTAETYTMKLEGTVDTEPVVLPEHPEFYLVGTFAQGGDGGWNTVDDWKFTCDETTNTYTLTGKDFSKDAAFKIAPKNWEFPEIVFGAANANEPVKFNEAINLAKGNTTSNNFVFGADAKNVTLVFKYVPEGTSTLTLTKEEGIDGIFGEADGEVEYYNLQGVRVMNPEKGIYIVRRGSKVTKEIVK